ncbi:unnamed protein product [Brassica rapa subsp. trilocularis]
MRVTLDFHGFSGGFTTVRQFLSRCWSSSEMLQGVEKEGFHMRVISICLYVNRYFLRFRSSLFRGGLVMWLGACGECLLRVVVLTRWVSKVQMCFDAPLHLGSSPLFCLLIYSTERLYPLNPFLPYRLAVLVSSWCRYGSGVNDESVSRTGLASLL